MWILQNGHYLVQEKCLKVSLWSHSHGLDVSVFVEFIHLFSTYLSDHLVYITFFL